MADYLAILRQYWGHDNFRGIQRQIIESIGSGNDTIGLMPTGEGKSVTFQVPAIAMPGLCLVITPLIALMKDQAQRLRNLGIKALTLHSGLDRQQILHTLDNAIYGQYKFLYLSPERLQSELFLKKLPYMQLNFITVDEAHCISQWGHDFRPAYLQIAQLRRQRPDIPILALTATATPDTVRDIATNLHMRHPHIHRMSFQRPNLAYIVRHTENKPQELLKTLQHNPGSAIVYTHSREKTQHIAQWLTQNNIPALHYHAALPQNDKDTRQKLWQTNRTRVIVATNAFGMGIDKPDVRLVIHADPPDSIEQYFQEAGRAGRDRQPAQAILLHNKRDNTVMQHRINENYPPVDYIRRVYEDICALFQIATGDGAQTTHTFHQQNFCTQFHHHPIPLRSALKILTHAGYIRYTPDDNTPPRILITLRREQLNRIQHLTPAAHTLLQAILRTSPGLFTQYVPLDIPDLAQRTRLTTDTIHQTLRNLNRQAILHYIPQQHTPHITFTQRRPDTDEIRLPQQHYQLPRQQYTQRINALIRYANNNNTCRSRQLLAYLGQNNTQNCHICDVCKNNTNNNTLQHDAASAIVRLLGDGEAHTLGEVTALPFPPQALQEALHTLALAEEVTVRDGRVWLN